MYRFHTDRLSLDMFGSGLCGLSHSGGKLQAERAPWVFQKSDLDKFHTVSILNCMYFVHNMRSTAPIRHFDSSLIQRRVARRRLGDF
ncbi:protein of unknown function [Methylocella tundrae]|uniref:Uncharacterized protein n=1 Tax=Methylocella tundrae TaxID=227605 RepID=A0A4V6IMM3_METTU|nr:protein of unknown function [Methylocella tundrae]